MWIAITPRLKGSLWLVVALSVLILSACNVGKSPAAGANSTKAQPTGSSSGDTSATASGSSDVNTTTSATPGSDIALPKPRMTDDAHPIINALNRRQSTRAFSNTELSTTQQSEIIWAAFGVNRPLEGQRRTAPSAWNCQDIDIYLLTSAGVFKYDAIDHAIVLVSAADERSQLGSSYSAAPLTLVYVSTRSKIPADDKVRYSFLHTGLVAMNVYIYAAHENLPVVVRADLPNSIAQTLKLTGDQGITLAQTIGLPAGQTNANGAPFRQGKLATPRYDSHPILKALKARRSATGFASTPLTNQVLGEVVWSGFGVNRQDGKRTAPSAHNWQDVDVYAALASGVYRYDATNHVLKTVSTADVRSSIGSTAASAPLTLVYVSDYGKLTSDGDRERFSAAHAGFIAQNVNVYAASEGLAAKVYESVADKNALSAAMRLNNNQQIKQFQSVGAPSGG